MEKKGRFSNNCHHIAIIEKHTHENIYRLNQVWMIQEGVSSSLRVCILFVV